MKTLLRSLIAIGAIVIVVVVTHDMSVSQGKRWTIEAKKAIFDDSLRVGGPVTINGDLVVSGTSTTGSSITSDSIASKLKVRDSLHVYLTETVNGALTMFGTATVNNKLIVTDSARINKTSILVGKATFNGPGFNLTLRTIAAGDSIFGHVILDAADTTIKAWNGSAWVTITDLIP